MIYIIPHPRGTCQTYLTSLLPGAVLNCSAAPDVLSRSLVFRPRTREQFAKFLGGVLHSRFQLLTKLDGPTGYWTGCWIFLDFSG